MNHIITITLSLLLSSSAGHPEIYEWRGIDRNGIYSESNLMKEWPAEGPVEIWSLDNIGNGFASPVFTENSFYITGEIDSMAILYCYDLKGQKQCQTTLGREWTRSSRGARSAPTITDKHIYTGTGMGDLYCLDRKSGKIIWSKSMAKDFQGILPLHGHSEAPVITGDKIFWTPGGKDYNVVALNRFTGKLIWSNKGFGERSGYHSPRVIEFSGKKILVTFSAYHLMGLDAETGKLLWSHEQDNFPMDKRIPGNGDTHANTVIFENGSIYYAAGDGNCGVKLTLSGDGTAITQNWRSAGFDSFMGGIVKTGSYLYGSGTVAPDIRSVNADSGVICDSLRIGSGAVIAADNMLYYYNQKGEMMLLSFDEGKMQKISSFKITKGTGQHFSHPVINKGILYQRHGKVLMAFDISTVHNGR
ncbi:MAG: PQQ-like beta-propeller repeat protein [Bacteroidetes bacterium]|nr:PQQ-like beta-propeller repeat protein [Bacteroidota bacterium]